MVEIGEDSTAEEVCAWLVAWRPEFSKYTAQIHENEIGGGAVLFAPVDDLLTMMGISSVGHRHLLRKEISTLRARLITNEEEDVEEKEAGAEEVNGTSKSTV